MRKLNYKFLLLGITVFASAGFCSPVTAGQLSWGAEYVGWSSNFSTPFNGWELWVPLSLNLKLDPALSLYGQSEFGNGNYTDSSNGTETIHLTNFSDTVVGGEYRFQSFSLPSMLNVGFNLPTGDSTWEAKQISADIPTEFLDSRYRGRGFGVNALYGLSFPSGSGEFGAAAGYLYSGAFNPSYGAGVQASQLKVGDSVFISVNHVQSYTGDQKEIIRLSSFITLPTQNNGQNIYQLGPNFNASYSWVDPRSLSFEAGVQYWLAGQMPDANGNLIAEPHPYYGPRLYLAPSYSFGDFTLAGLVKYIFSNGYSTSDGFYDGGGIRAGIDPSYRLKLDNSSDLKINASFDDILWMNGGYDANFNRTNVNYNLWVFGATYELKL